jgi:tRNA A-37 threonylcarbamoyl transferase component Bud32
VTAQRHQQVMQLFHDALAKDRSQRENFLREACGADDCLRSEVKSLLENHQSRTILIRHDAGSTDALSGEMFPAPARGPTLSWTRAGRRNLQIGLAALTLALAVLSLGYWLETGIERPFLANVSTELSATSDSYVALTHVRRTFWTVFSLLAISAALAFVFALFTARLRREVGAARQLGQYTLEELIGEGGMGKVYKARHAFLRRATAVKVLDGALADRTAIARFEREVQVTSSMTHPNTVEIYDYGRTEDDVFFFAMEYLPGVTLEALVRSEGRICPARVLHILRQMLGSLAEAHALGLVHRDVKPANVILCQRGGLSDFVKVVDFGLAMDPSFNLAPQITQTGLISGTPLYIAPECLDDPTTVSARSDLYAVGTVAFLLLTGRDLFVAASPMDIFRCMTNDARPRPSDCVPDGIPSELDELVFRCVAKNPMERPESARDMLTAVASIAANHVWSERDADRWWREHMEDHTLQHFKLE